MHRFTTPLTLLFALSLSACSSPYDGGNNAATKSSAKPPGKSAKADSKPAAKSAKAGGDAKRPTKEAAEEPAAEVDPKLLDPSAATEKAPKKYKVKFETTKGDFVVEVNRDWAPKGADRFYNLVKVGFYNDVAFFRAIKGFMVQFGLHGVPKVNSAWRGAKIGDDPVSKSNKKGFITFATSGKDSRTTQVFINFGNNANLDGMGFSPFGKVVEGAKVVDSLHTGYGEGAPRGRGPAQAKIQRSGNAYLKKDFPDLDYVKTATILE